MAYGKRYTGYKRSRYSRSYPRKRTAMSGRYRYANNITLTNRYTRIGKVSLRDVELKYKDSTHDHATADIGPDHNDAAAKSAVSQLCLIAANADPDGRIGRKIVVKEIQGTVIATMNAHQSDVLKITVVQDRQCNGAAIAASDVFSGKQIVDFPQISNSKRFNILAMKMKSLNWTASQANADGTAYSNGETRAVLSFKIPCNIEINYLDAASTIDKIRSNNICVIFQTREGKTAVASRWRLRFSDI